MLWGWEEGSSWIGRGSSGARGYSGVGGCSRVGMLKLWGSEGTLWGWEEGSSWIGMESSGVEIYSVVGRRKFWHWEEEDQGLGKLILRS